MTDFQESSPDADVFPLGSAHVGASEPAPDSGMVWLDTSGSPGIGGRIAVRTITASDTALDSDTVLLCDATGGPITVTLPAALTRLGKAFYITKIDTSANLVTIDANGAETIDRDLTFDLYADESLSLISDNSNWWSFA